MEDIYSIYVQVSEMAPRARMAYLESIELSAESRRELDALLQELEEYSPGRTKVRTLVVGTVENSMPRPEARIGQSVGPYRLERLVVDSEGHSAGNMGDVYFARRVDGAFEQTVAVKVVQQLGEDTDSRSRFIRERRYLGRLRHPNIVRILDAGALPAGSGEDADEHPYFIMEWVEDGLDIATYCRRNELNLRQRIELLRQVCEGVAYAHSQGVVHRDLKPQNILVDGQGVPRLLDFGISSHQGDEGDSALMRSAMTLAYASPEQLAKAPVGPASDIYSLGLILFEIVVGQRPYEVTGDWETARELVENLVPPRLGAAFDLDQIVQKSLSKDLDRRYRHIDQLVADLRRYLQREPVKAAREHLSRLRLGYVWANLYWLMRYSRKYVKPLAALVLLVILVLLAAGELGRREIVAVQNRLTARRLATEAAMALERQEYNAAGVLALESAQRESSDLALRILQKVIPRLPRRLFEDARLPQPVRLVSFSPNHLLLAVLLRDGTMQVRNAETGALRNLEARGSLDLRGVNPCIAWSGNGSHLALLDSAANLSIWDTANSRLVMRRNFHAAGRNGGFDCLESSSAGLRYAGPADWDLLLPAAASALWLSSQGDRTTTPEVLGCAPAAARCLLRGEKSLDLLDLRSHQRAVLVRSDLEGVLSPDGRWAAARLSDYETQVFQLAENGQVTAVASFGSRTNPTRPVRFQAGGARLLMAEGGQWRVFLPWLRTTFLARREPEFPGTPQSAALFMPQASSVGVLMARTETGMEPIAVPAEGVVSATSEDEVSGTFAVADRAGLRLLLWRLPEWPGSGGMGGAVMASDGQRSWAAGWTRNGALVTYSLVDGSVERVLQSEVSSAGSGPQVWAVGGTKWLLSYAGGAIRSWDPMTGRPIGAIGLVGSGTALAADSTGHWLALSAEGGRGAQLYEFPALRLARTFPESGVLGIAVAPSAEVSVLLGDIATGSSRYRLEILSPNASSVHQMKEIKRGIDFGAFDVRTLKRAVGPPCSSLEGVAKEPGEILFPMARVRDGIDTGCAVLRVAPDAAAVRVDEVPYQAPETPGWSVRTSAEAPSGRVRLEVRRSGAEAVLVSEFLPGQLRSSWQPTPGGVAFYTGETWRAVLFSESELKDRFCAGGLVNLPPDFLQRYSLAKLTACGNR